MTAILNQSAQRQALRRCDELALDWSQRYELMRSQGHACMRRLASLKCQPHCFGKLPVPAPTHRSLWNHGGEAVVLLLLYTGEVQFGALDTLTAAYRLAYRTELWGAGLVIVTAAVVYRSKADYEFAKA